MFQIIALALWMLAGIVAAFARPEPGEARLAWAPVAVFFGPMWLLIALERDPSLTSGALDGH